MKKFVLITLSFIFFLRSVPVQAGDNIRINEFRIEPEQSIEIVNTSENSIDISGWYIDDSGGNTYFTIPHGSIIKSNSCITFTASFNLNKSSSDTVRLFDSSSPPTASDSAAIDSYSYSVGPGLNFSFSRIPDKNGEFKSLQSSLGNWNETGQSCLDSPTPSPSPTPSINMSSEDNQDEDESINNIFLSEVMVRPFSGDNEWIEIYNANNFSVDIANWYIDDQENSGSSPKQFSTIVNAGGYAVIEIETSMFNNSGDTVRILDSSKTERDSFEYLATSENKTLGREYSNSQKFCIQEPSKSFPNNSCAPFPETITSTKTPTPSKTLTPTKAIFPSKQSGDDRVLLKTGTKSLNGEKNNSSLQSGNTEVLGARLNLNSRAADSKIKTFSFLSISYSLLTIASIFLKIKFGYAQT